MYVLNTELYVCIFDQIYLTVVDNYAVGVESFLLCRLFSGIQTIIAISVQA